MMATFEKEKEKDKLELLLRAQQPKMKELWGNEEDEAWEDAEPEEQKKLWACQNKIYKNSLLRILRWKIERSKI